MSITQQYADLLSERFPSRITTSVDGCTISAAALAAYTFSLVQRDEAQEAAALMPALGLAYSGGACADLEADLPAILKTQEGLASRALLERTIRQIIRDGYDAASGKLAAAV